VGEALALLIGVWPKPDLPARLHSPLHSPATKNASDIRCVCLVMLMLPPVYGQCRRSCDSRSESVALFWASSAFLRFRQIVLGRRRAHCLNAIGRCSPKCFRLGSSRQNQGVSARYRERKQANSADEGVPVHKHLHHMNATSAHSRICSARCESAAIVDVSRRPTMAWTSRSAVAKSCSRREVRTARPAAVSKKSARISGVSVG
jgi:hypothetical protein